MSAPRAAAAPLEDEAMGSAAPLTGSERFLRAFLQHRPAVVSAGYLTALVLIALAGLHVVPQDPLTIDLARTFEGPSAEHWLGTDHLGRSTLARIVAATAVALKAAALGVGIALGLGAPLGLLSGYFGGWWDRIAMRVVEAIIALPALLVAIAILAILGPSLTNAMIALGVANATAFFRLMRATALEVREAVYVDAARVSGAATARILLRHVLPNVTGPLTVQTTLTFAYVLLAEAGLSFIGLGVQPPEASWGVMLATAQNYLHHHPFMVAPPGLMIVFSVLAFNLVGDGLRDALARVEVHPAAAHKPAGGVGAPGRLTEIPAAEDTPLLVVRDLEVSFPAPRGGELTVVSGVDFEVRAGRTVGLVGESGCGKSVTAMAIMGLLGEAGRIGRGSIRFAGRELVGMPRSELNRIRGDEIVNPKQKCPLFSKAEMSPLGEVAFVWVPVSGRLTWVEDMPLDARGRRRIQPCSRRSLRRRAGWGRAIGQTGLTPAFWADWRCSPRWSGWFAKPTPVGCARASAIRLGRAVRRP